MGKISHDRGKRFERKCCRLLPSLLDHTHFKRTGSIGKQHRGDIVACDADGKDVPGLLDHWYIECKGHSALTANQIRQWAIDAAKAGHYAESTWLLFGQPRGPVYALHCDPFRRRTDWPIRCEILE
jgi:hypothetical protein